MGAAGAVVMRSVEKVSPASQMTSEINPATERTACVTIKYHTSQSSSRL